MKLVTVTPTGAGSSCGLKEGTDIVARYSETGGVAADCGGAQQQLEALS